MGSRCANPEKPIFALSSLSHRNYTWDYKNLTNQYFFPWVLSCSTSAAQSRFMEDRSYFRMSFLFCSISHKVPRLYSFPSTQCLGTKATLQRKSFKIHKAAAFLGHMELPWRSHSLRIPVGKSSRKLVGELQRITQEGWNC